MNNELTFESTNPMEEAVATTGHAPSLDLMFLAAFGSFIFAGLYFVGTLF